MKRIEMAEFSQKLTPLNVDKVYNRLNWNLLLLEFLFSKLKKMASHYLKVYYYGLYIWIQGSAYLNGDSISDPKEKRGGAYPK